MEIGIQEHHKQTPKTQLKNSIEQNQTNRICYGYFLSNLNTIFLLKNVECVCF